MGSSGSSDFGEPPRGPNPPADMIIPQGGSAPLHTNFINFLGDTNQPSTGLTPEMLQQIMGSGNPQGGGPPNPGAQAAAPPPVANKRAQLADVMMRRSGGEGGAGHSGAGSGGNSGGWGGH